MMKEIAIKYYNVPQDIQKKIADYIYETLRKEPDLLAYSYQYENGKNCSEILVDNTLYITSDANFCE